MRIGISTAQKRNMMKGKAFNLSHAQLNGEAKKGKVHEVEIGEEHSKGMESRMQCNYMIIASLHNSA